LSLFYDTDDDPEYDRIEQTGETDLEFLMRLCSDAGLCLKISDKQIVIFDEKKYEDQAAIETIKKGDKRIKSYSGRTTLNKLYKASRVEYHNPTKGSQIRYEFNPPKPPKTGRVLVINEQVDSIKQAERLAKKRLRQAKKNGTTFSLTLTGEFRYLAGLTVNLEEFGSFDGKYIIIQAIHGQPLQAPLLFRY
jgi:phage protein D